MAGAINFQKSIVQGSDYVGAQSMPINRVNDNIGIIKEKNVFESFLDAAVNHLNNVSKIEIQANNLADDYIKGKASIEDASFAMGRAREMLRYTTAVVNNMVTSFKEIQQIQI
jgi:flagellar hook-basal body complex protein FliE